MLFQSTPNHPTKSRLSPVKPPSLLRQVHLMQPRSKNNRELRRFFSACQQHKKQQGKRQRPPLCLCPLSQHQQPRSKHLLQHPSPKLRHPRYPPQAKSQPPSPVSRPFPSSTRHLRIIRVLLTTLQHRQQPALRLLRLLLLFCLPLEMQALRRTRLPPLFFR